MAGRQMQWAACLVAAGLVWSFADARPVPPTLTRGGLGALHVGMGLREAEQATGRKIILEKNSSDDLKVCALASVQGLPGIGLLLEGYRVKVITITGQYKTTDGVRVGMTETELRGLFRTRAQFDARPYEDGAPGAHNVMVRLGGNREFLFQTRNYRVDTISVGDRPAVEYWEGCS